MEDTVRAANPEIIELALWEKRITEDISNFVEKYAQLLQTNEHLFNTVKEYAQIIKAYEEEK